jgi:hypothetical protein
MPSGHSAVASLRRSGDGFWTLRAFDLAMTRFSGSPAPPRDGPVFMGAARSRALGSGRARKELTIDHRDACALAL